MELKVLRYSDNGESTIGLLFVDNKFECYTLEDEARTHKVFNLSFLPLLFIPLGDGLLSPAEAYKMALLYEPNIIIPMCSDAKLCNKFLNEAGAENVKSVDKLTIKKKDVEGKEGELFVLKDIS